MSFLGSGGSFPKQGFWKKEACPASMTAHVTASVLLLFFWGFTPWQSSLKISHAPTFLAPVLIHLQLQRSRQSCLGLQQPGTH